MSYHLDKTFTATYFDAGGDIIVETLIRAVDYEDAQYRAEKIMDNYRSAAYYELSEN